MERVRLRRRLTSYPSQYDYGDMICYFVGSSRGIPSWEEYVMDFYRPDNSNERARVADVDTVLRRQLPVVAPGSEDDCAICLQDLIGSPEEEAAPRAMPCSHAFHERCIFQWLRQNRACPICRRSLPPPTPQQQQYEPRPPPRQQYEPRLQPQQYEYHDDDRLQLTMPVPQEMLEVEVLL